MRETIENKLKTVISTILRELGDWARIRDSFPIAALNLLEYFHKLEMVPVPKGFCFSPIDRNPYENVPTHAFIRGFGMVEPIFRDSADTIATLVLYARETQNGGKWFSKDRRPSRDYLKSLWREAHAKDFTNPDRVMPAVAQSMDDPIVYKLLELAWIVCPADAITLLRDCGFPAKNE